MIAVIVGLIVVLLVAGAQAFMIAMPGASYRGPLAPLREEEAALRDRLARHVVVLAEEIGARSVGVDRAGLGKAEEYVTSELRAIGLEPVRETFQVGAAEVANVVAERRGSRRPEEIVLVGAHYDAVGGVPGADDNASGVAALIEIARLLPPLARTVRFVAFVNEEPPYFQTDAMGSLVHAKRSHDRGDRITAMISLESVGYFSTLPKSQVYPPPFSWFYPDRGDFIAFVGDLSSRSLVRSAVGTFRETAAFPAEGVASPSFIPGIGWSDQWAFWQHGYPAIMVTDTAPFRNPNYHTMNDRPGTIDYDRMTRVVKGLVRVIERLASS
jgi:hypothetical protein